jgi:GMP synthase-like glutamine amidotransferase
MMRLHGIRHESFETEAGIADWARDRGHSLTHTDLFAGQALPALDSFDWLVVMGGPMNVDEEDRFAWLAGEKRLIRAAADAGKLVLGVCLGAQLISVALGGVVSKGRYREIGWHKVLAGPDAGRSQVFRNLPLEYEAFHWHGDTFTIPADAFWTARSEACAHQAFTAREDRVVALQFHLETSAASMADIAAHCADEITPGEAQPYIQGAAQMTDRPERLTALRELLYRLLDNMAALG